MMAIAGAHMARRLQLGDRTYLRTSTLATPSYSPLSDCCPLANSLDRILSGILESPELAVPVALVTIPLEKPKQIIDRIHQ